MLDPLVFPFHEVKVKVLSMACEAHTIYTWLLLSHGL
jgi:hypothetical protein